MAETGARRHKTSVPAATKPPTDWFYRILQKNLVILRRTSVDGVPTIFYDKSIQDKSSRIDKMCFAATQCQITQYNLPLITALLIIFRYLFPKKRVNSVKLVFKRFYAVIGWMVVGREGGWAFFQPKSGVIFFSNTNFFKITFFFRCYIFN